MVLIPFDQFKNLISQCGELPTPFKQDKSSSEDLNSLKLTLDRGKKRIDSEGRVSDKKQSLKRNSFSNEPDISAKKLKKVNQSIINKPEDNTIKKNGKVDHQKIKSKFLKPPPPGLPNQLGAGIKKSDLYNFNSPVPEKVNNFKSKDSINDLIKKHWTK